MLENFSDEQVTKALKNMEVNLNNQMRQEFVEGLRKGRPGNYIGLREFMDKLGIKHNYITEQMISGVLQNTGWLIISKMREQIINGVLDKDPEEYTALRKFFDKMKKEISNE